MFKSFYLSVALAFGLVGCSGRSEIVIEEDKLEDIIIREDVTRDDGPDIIRLRKSKEVIDIFGTTYTFEPGIYLAICEGEAWSGEFLYDPRETQIYFFCNPLVDVPIQDSIELRDTNGDGIKDLVYMRPGTRERIILKDDNGDGIWETNYRQEKRDDLIFKGMRSYPYFEQFSECSPDHYD